MGVAALGAGVSLVVASTFRGDDHQPPAQSRRARLTPVIGRHVVGANLSGRF
jgi:hypothetical protein